jgi:nitrile hydratase
MNGVHDMGGMHGLGPIEAPADEPLFHAPWEARVLALTLAMGAWGRWNIDASRHQRELIPGPDYLAMTYYEKWFTALIALAVKADLISREEARTGAPAPGAAKATPPLTAEGVPALLADGGPADRDVAAPRRFAIGDRVRARNLNPAGHTRLPRYARGRLGVIERDHGVHVLPDANAHGLGEHPQRLYGVRFTAGELWGEAAPAGDSLHLDLWDRYLDPA